MTEIELNEALGQPEALAERAATEYRKESWIRRHPLCVFGFTPLPAALLGLTLYLLLAWGASELLECCFGELPVRGNHEKLARSIITAYGFTIGFVPFGVCALLFGWLAARSKVSRRWLAVAVAQVGIVAWMVVVTTTFSDVPGQSKLMIGLRLPMGSNLTPWAFIWGFLRSSGPSCWLQLALPLAVGIIYLRTGARRVNA